MLKPLRWTEDGLELLDQRLLPHEEKWLLLRTHAEVAAAIKDMAVRGAPAIGIAAAYGMVLGLKYGKEPRLVAQELAETRPTAVNLAWA
ncbi:MAG TPA: hypothetical protein VKT78_13630, partial [Fimbriimonadaceae bacterium]|nr:hypothetical protein [Fimbriimonadaceae bacterium]